MGIVPTLKNRSSAVKVGSLVIQPEKNVFSLERDDKTGILRDILPSTERPLADFSISIGGSKKETQTFASTLITALSNRPTTILSNGINQIKPSYITHFSPGVVNRKNSVDEQKKSIKQYEPYEILSGVSSERPEIILLTPFQPIFQQDASDINEKFLTDVGQYVLTQLNARNLFGNNINQLFEELESNRFISNELKTKNSEFSKKFEEIKDLSYFLLSLIKRINNVKAHLDIRNDVHTVDTPEIANVISTAAARSQYFTSVIQKQANKIPKEYTIVDSLENFGFKRNLIQEQFSSTKVWLQLLYEYKNLVQHHSRELLDLDTKKQEQDTSPISITKTNDTFFSLNVDDPIGLGTVVELISINYLDVKNTLNATTKAFDSIYRNAKFKSDEIRIAALTNVLCKEYRFSRALKQNSTRRVLNDYYGFSVTDNSDGNLRVFDNIVGQFGTTIFDVPSQTNNSLTSLSLQRPVSDVAVLPFETKYLDGDNGTLTPGASYYVDSIYENISGDKLDFSRIIEFRKILSNALKQFNVIIDEFSILETRSDEKNKKDITFDSTTDFLKEILGSFLDSSGNTNPRLKSDKFGSLFVMAANNPKLKSILFHLCLNKMFKSNYSTTQREQIDNIPVVNQLITNLFTILVSSTKESKANQTFQRSLILENDFDESAIKSLIKNGSPTIDIMNSVLIRVYEQFQKVSVNDRVLYSAQMDIVIMMITFDLMISLFAKYSNQRIVSRRSGDNKQITYEISKTFVNHKTSAATISSRLEKESTETSKVTFAITSILKKLSNSLQFHEAYLRTPLSQRNIKLLQNYVPQHLMTSALDEQQIMLLGTQISNITSKLSRSDKTFKMLDNSMIEKKSSEAMLTFFNSPELRDKRSVNKKIVSVGIPLGFSKKIKQQLNVDSINSTSFASKQSDIVQIAIYKIDLLNQDLIYKPVKFLFELSRFPVKDAHYFKTLKQGATLSDVFDSIPTRDWEESIDDSSDSIAYWNSKLSYKSNTHNALDSDSYNFLSISQKNSLIKNHISSLMLEMYVKLTCGLDVSEETFNIEHLDEQYVDQNLLKTAFDVSLQNILNGTQNLTRDNSSSFLQPIQNDGIKNDDNVDKSINAGQRIMQLKNTKPNLDLTLLSERHISYMKQTLTTMNNASKALSTISNPDAVMRNLLTPKQFDRVFHLILDPDEFEIDVKATSKSQYGTSILQRLINKGDVQAFDNSTTTQGTSILQINRLISLAKKEAFKFRDKDRSEGDLSLEKYFISVETFGEDVL